MQRQTMVAVVYQAVVVALCALAAVEPVPFSWDSVMEAALPALQPFVEASSTKCEALKNFFGITYDQMQSRNVNPYNNVDVVHLRRTGNYRFNLTKSLPNYLAQSDNLYILIHGFMESSDGQMVQTVAPELMKKQSTTVLALDGRNIFSLEYFRSSTYVRFVGEKLGEALIDMIGQGLDPDSVTLVGHSLGAHIAGIAGKQVARVGRKLGRITALDPAGPCFASADPLERLDKTDAEYVDVIHTSSGFLGIKEPIGHKDFYPNGGMSQPGCFFSTCDHSRAWQLYAEAVAAPDHFPARKCITWSVFREGQCQNGEVAFLGPNSRTGSPGIYFLSTGASLPYGLGAVGSGK